MELAAGFQELRWVTVVKSVALVLFGLLTLAWPALTLATLAVLFAFFLLAVGIMDIFGGFTSIGRSNWWWLKIIVGIAAVSVGVYLAEHPDLTLSLFVLLLGLYFLVRGVLDMVYAFEKGINNNLKAILAINGVLGIVLGFIILRYPVEGSLAFVWVIGLYALIAGPILLVLSLGERLARET